jgi:myosin heavy subunit
MIHHTPLDTPIAGPSGNPGAAGFTSFGCPVFSAGDAQVTETMPIEAQATVLKWIQQVALQGETYKNEIVEILGEDDSGIAAEGDSWGTPAAEGNDDGELEAQAKDTKFANSKTKGSDGEAQVIEVNDKTSENTRAKDTAKAKGTGTNTAADGKTKGRGDEAQTIESDDKAIEGSMKALVKNVNVTDKTIKAIEANIKTMEGNRNPTEEEIKAMKEYMKAAEENVKAIEEDIKAIVENDKAIATTQAKKEAAQANSASTKATSTQAAGSNTNTDNKVESAKGNDVAETGGVKTRSENTPFLPTDEGPNAEDMKELVTEMTDLTAPH